MLKKGKIYILIAAIVTVAVVIVALQYTKRNPPHIREMKKFQELLREDGMAFTTEEAQVFVRELMPLVEKSTGKEFIQTPEVVLVDRKGLQWPLVRDLLPQLRIFIKDMSENQLVQVATRRVNSMAPFLLGKYGMEDKILYLLPGNFLPLLKLSKINERHAKSIIKLIIAHELTHALQDQEVDLWKKCKNVNGPEESEALEAAMEGHAVFVQEQVAKQLGLDDTAIEYSRLLVGGTITHKDATMEMVRKKSSARFEQIYLGGKRFIEYYYNKGGNKRVWNILKAPPVETSMISNPEAYSPVRKKKFDYAKTLEGLDKYFGKGNWSVRNTEITKLQLRSSYVNMEANKRDENISKITHAQALIVKNIQNFSKGKVVIMTLKSDKDCHKLISDLEVMALNNIEKMKNSTMQKIEAFVIRDFVGIEADISRKLTATAKPAQGKSYTYVLIRSCRGNVLVQVTSNNLHISDEKIRAISEKVFNRYNEMKEQQEG